MVEKLKKWKKVQVLRKESSFDIVWKAMRGSADRFSVGEVVIFL